MERILPADIIKQLATRNGLCHPDGQVNYNAFSRRSNLAATTVMRLVQAKENWDMSRKVAKTLMKSFNLTEAQARGYEPLDVIQSKVYKPSRKDLEILKNLRALDAREQNNIETYIAIRKEISETTNLTSEEITALINKYLKSKIS